jgi:hypothetical protein
MINASKKRTSRGHWFHSCKPLIETSSRDIYIENPDPDFAGLQILHGFIFESLKLLDFDLLRIRLQLFTLMRIQIRIQLPKIMRIRIPIRNSAEKDPEYFFWDLFVDPNQDNVCFYDRQIRKTETVDRALPNVSPEILYCHSWLLKLPFFILPPKSRSVFPNAVMVCP